MKKNGAEVIHLATGLVVGYPPCQKYPLLQDIHRDNLRTARGRWHPSHPAKIYGCA
jgi:hypothetical protein